MMEPTPAPTLVAAGSADKQAPQKAPAEKPAPTRTLTSRAFWQAVDRLQIADADALGLIDYPGKLAPSVLSEVAPNGRYGKLPPVQWEQRDALSDMWINRDPRAT